MSMSLVRRDRLELRAHRKRLGMSLEAFGRALCPDRPYHYSTVWRWERGQRPIPATLLDRARKLT